MLLPACACTCVYWRTVRHAEVCSAIFVPICSCMFLPRCAGSAATLISDSCNASCLFQHVPASVSPGVSMTSLVAVSWRILQRIESSFLSGHLKTPCLLSAAGTRRTLDYIRCTRPPCPSDSAQSLLSAAGTRRTRVFIVPRCYHLRIMCNLRWRGNILKHIKAVKRGCHWTTSSCQEILLQRLLHLALSSPQKIKYYTYIYICLFIFNLYIYICI